MTTGEEGTLESADVQEVAELESLRASNEALRRQLEERTTPAGTPWWRNRWLSVGSAIAAGVLLPFAVIALWAQSTLLNTDDYVATVAPLAENEDIQEAVSFRVAETVSEQVDFRSIAEDALPENAQVLAGPIEAGAEGLIAELAGVAVATPAFAQLWEEANRETHQRLVPLITGDGGDLVDTKDGRVVVKLETVAEDVLGRLDERLGTELSARVSEEEFDAEVVLFESEELADVQTGARWLDRLRWVLAVLAVGLGVGAVAMSEHRRLGARRLGLALVVPMILSLVFYSFARSQYVANLPEGVHNVDAAIAAFDILTTFLQRALRALLVIGALVLLGAWIVGPSPSAGRARQTWTTFVDRAGEGGSGREVGGVVRWVGSNARSLQYALVAGAGVLLVLWNHPTGLVILLVAVVTLAAIAAVRVVAEVAGRAVSPG